MGSRRNWVVMGTLAGVFSLSLGACLPKKTGSETKASGKDRAVIGLAKDYIPDYECDGLHPITGKSLADPAALFDEDPSTLRRNPSLRGAFTEKLASSMRERRKFGWCVAQKAFWPTGIPTADNAQSVHPIPTWLTWFEAHEFEAIFRSLYAEQAATQKKQYPEITDELISAAFKQRIETLKKTGLQRSSESFNKDLREKSPLPGVPETQLQVTALGGRGFTLFSPAYVRHLIKNYEAISHCQINSEVKIPEIFAKPALTDKSNFSAPCLKEEFPPEAVMAKAVWMPIEKKGKATVLPYFRSDAEGVEKLFSTYNYAWFDNKIGDATATEREIFSQEDNKGTKYGLVALHFTTKETRDWVWTTYWWSPATAKAIDSCIIKATVT